MVKRRNNSKYYNVKTKTTDGLVFDSTKEARRWEQLLLLQRAGKISHLERQVRYELTPNQYEVVERYGKKGQRIKDGEKLVYKKAEYVADFRYRDTETGEVIVEDVKGYTKGEAYSLFMLKCKVLYMLYKIKVRVVK